MGRARNFCKIFTLCSIVTSSTSGLAHTYMEWVTFSAFFGQVIVGVDNSWPLSKALIEY